MQRGGSVYIMSNLTRTTLYIGVTADLRSRVVQHKEDFYPNSFTSRYKLYHCVYYESFFSIEEAIAREKEIKKWRREKKDNLIRNMNPGLKDLWDEIQYW